MMSLQHERITHISIHRVIHSSVCPSIHLAIATRIQPTDEPLKWHQQLQPTKFSHTQELRRSSQWSWNCSYNDDYDDQDRDQNQVVNQVNLTDVLTIRLVSRKDSSGGLCNAQQKHNFERFPKKKGQVVVITTLVLYV